MERGRSKNCSGMCWVFAILKDFFLQSLLELQMGEYNFLSITDSFAEAEISGFFPYAFFWSFYLQNSRFSPVRIATSSTLASRN